MFATIVHNYNGFSESVWVLGSIAIGYSLKKGFPNLSNFKASVIGFFSALAVACLFGVLNIVDTSVVHQLEFYIYFSSWILDRWDYSYKVPNTVLYHLIPLYYAYRFLSLSRRNSIVFAAIPLLIAAYLEYVISCHINEGYLRYQTAGHLVATVHILVAGLFIARGVWTISHPKKIEELQPIVP